MFGQTFELHDLAIIALLVALEGILSIDNALVLGVLAKRLPKHQQRKALTYGLLGAFFFRVIAIGLAAYLMRVTLVKLVGGGYLLFISVKHFLGDKERPEELEMRPADLLESSGGNEPTRVTDDDRPLIAKLGLDLRFWYAVGVIELTDIAFAIDSILAAVGLVSGDGKTWVVITGGFMGVIMMRFAAVLFIKLLERFPRFEHAAYLLVLVIGAKLVIDWASYQFHFHDSVNFHSPSAAAFWVFWVAMLACLGFGFLPAKQKSEPAGVVTRSD
jgi:YkoY family integral membrane protein